MSISWKISRVAGIDLFLHPTLLILLAVVAVLGGLPAVILYTLVFGCVLLHELGHALAARRFGIETEDITLYPIGGVARLERLPRSPGAELVIALAGPAVNVVIAATLALVGGLAGPWADTLMKINVGLVLFNLLPIFPMDGGRVLRALLSGAIGRGRATEVAATIGQGVALAAGFYGLTPGHWLLALLAAFVFLAAGAERDHVRAESVRRPSSPRRDEGIWIAPPGHSWVNRGPGVWQLVPIPVHAADSSTRARRPWL